MSQSLATVAYLGLPSLSMHPQPAGGLSNPRNPRRGNLFGMVGMALAVLATVFARASMPAASPDRRRAGGRWRYRPVCGQGRQDDPDARAGRPHAHSLVGLAACLQALPAMSIPNRARGRRKSHSRGGKSTWHPDRCRHLLGLADRLRQACQRQDRRQAAVAVCTPLAQSACAAGGGSVWARSFACPKTVADGMCRWS